MSDETKTPETPKAAASGELLAGVHEVLIIMATWVFKSVEKRALRKAATKVARAFEGVDWAKQIFHVNGVVTNVDGETKFYKVGEIDAAIKKLNKVLRELSS